MFGKQKEEIKCVYCGSHSVTKISKNDKNKSNVYVVYKCNDCNEIFAE